MFKFDNRWDVDKDAESLNASLFGKSKKRKVVVPTSARNGSKFNSSVIPDSDDEQYSKNDKKRLKKRRKKTKYDGKTSETDFNGLQQGCAIISIAAKSKKNLKTAEVSGQKQKVNKSVIKTGSNIVNVKSKKVQQNGKLQENNTNGDLSSDKLREKKSRKRKRSSSENTDNVNSKNKKAKIEESKSNTVSTNDDTASGDGKKKRKRKKKNNSKSNKYKHLALNFNNRNEDLEMSQVSGPGVTSTTKEPVNKKTIHTILDHSSNKSTEILNSKDNFSQIIGTRIPDIQQNTNNNLESAPVQMLSKKKIKKVKADTQLLLSQNGNRQNSQTPVKKLKKDKENPKDQALANSSQSWLVRKESESTKVSMKNKLSKKVLMKILNEAQNKPDKAFVNRKDGFTLDKKKKNMHAVTSVQNGENICNVEPSPNNLSTPANKFVNKTARGSKQANITWDMNKSTVNTVSPVSQSIWGKAAELGLQAKEKLNSARFRYINEQLYSCRGVEALDLFNNDHDAFSVYHEGFQNQTNKWPVNPIDALIKQIKEKPKNLVIADFGCGDAKLAQNIPQKVHSFDLVALNNRVTACDMSKTPLPKEQVDIAVFCLSLMGTNLSDYILEANRVLKTGGLLKVAEVVSRFSGLSRFTDAVCSYGFQLLNKRDVKEMFYMMDFKKVKSVKKSASLPVIKLKPCIYKRR